MFSALSQTSDGEIPTVHSRISQKSEIPSLQLEQDFQSVDANSVECRRSSSTRVNVCFYIFV